jgi:hypothetical protein
MLSHQVLGSTPYVENGALNEFKVSDLKVVLEVSLTSFVPYQNIEWTIRTAQKFKLHLDFHIDYNLDPQKEASISTAIDLLKTQWPGDRTVVFGHCTRLTLFSETEWLELALSIKNLPVFFIGLPTSDMFMMGRPDASSTGGQRVRGTLQIPQMISKYGLNAAVGINNVGNAFTPQGSCDPLSLASLGVGIYQAGTKNDADLLFVCILYIHRKIANFLSNAYQVEQRQPLA